MDFTQSYSQLQQNGFVVKQMQNGFEAHGIYKAFSILSLISTNKNTNNATIIFSVDDANIRRSVLKQLKQVIGRGTAVQDVFKLKITTTVCTDPSNEVLPIIDRIAECLASNGIKTKSRCYVCGRDGCNCAVIDDGAYTAAHVDCVKYQIAHDTKKAATLSKGNIFTGIIGAILGAVVGAIPTILTIAFANRIFGLLCLLIPMCSYWGYKLFKGKVNRATVWIVSVISLLQAFLIVIINIWIVYESYYTLYQSALLLIGYTSEFADILGTTLLFVGIGIFAAWSYIKKRPADYAVSAQVTQESALYYDFGGAAVSPHTMAQAPAAQQNLPENMQDSNV